MDIADGDSRDQIERDLSDNGDLDIVSDHSFGSNMHQNRGDEAASVFEEQVDIFYDEDRNPISDSEIHFGEDPERMFVDPDVPGGNDEAEFVLDDNDFLDSEDDVGFGFDGADVDSDGNPNFDGVVEVDLNNGDREFYQDDLEELRQSNPEAYDFSSGSDMELEMDRTPVVDGLRDPIAEYGTDLEEQVSKFLMK